MDNMMDKTTCVINMDELWGCLDMGYTVPPIVAFDCRENDVSPLGLGCTSSRQPKYTWMMLAV